MDCTRDGFKRWDVRRNCQLRRKLYLYDPVVVYGPAVDKEEPGSCNIDCCDLYLPRYGLDGLVEKEVQNCTHLTDGKFSVIG